MVANETRSRILPESQATTVPEASGVRVDPLAAPEGQAGTAAPDRRRCMTGRAVALLVAADTGIEVALRLPGMMPRPAQAFGPQGFRGMKPAAAVEIAGRAGKRDAGPLVAAEAE